MSFYDYCCAEKKLITAHAIKFDSIISSGNFQEIHNIICESNSKNLQLGNLVDVSDLFFLWIGCIRNVALEYINVWEEAYGNSCAIKIYYDRGFLLFAEHKAVFQKIYRNSISESIDALIAHQNEFYDSINGFMADGRTYDESLIEIAKLISHEESIRLANLLVKHELRMLELGRKYNIVDISDGKYFYSNFLRHMYCRELVLRGSAAAAADILRLSILYINGGVYVDVDTLPSLDSIFGTIQHNLNENIVNIVKSEYYMQRRKGGIIQATSRVKGFERLIFKANPKILFHMRRCVLNLKDVRLSCGRISVHPDLISMAGQGDFKGFNNNVLIACKGSRLVRIILREVMRRYKYIADNGFDFSIKDLSGNDENNLNRLTTYRLDSLIEESRVTSILTGPAMILEVILGVSYKILSLDDSISPMAVAYALNFNFSAVVFRDHINFTPEHVRSSWMA